MLNFQGFYLQKKLSVLLSMKHVSSIDIEVIRTVFNFILFHEENSKHLKHKQKASKLTFNQVFLSKQKHLS